mgnify:CR=1 FL=1
MVEKKTIGDYAFSIINGIIMVLLMIITAYPMYYVVIASITEPAEVMANTGVMLLPGKISFTSYKLLLEYPMMFVSYKNTFIYVIVGTAISLTLTTLGGYSLSRTEVPGVKQIMMLVTFTMFFSGGLIPKYLLVQNLNLLDTIWAIVLPGALSTMNMIIMRTSFMGIPKSLEESARLDGAGDFRILWSIMLPLSTAILAVMTLFYAVGYWNDFFNPMIYLKTRNKFPLQLLLREILVSNSTDELTAGVGDDKSLISQVIKYSTIVVSTVPILCVYPFLQKFFTKGVMIGAVKG